MTVGPKAATLRFQQVSRSISSAIFKELAILQKAFFYNNFIRA
jgi:hypothetical protein